MAGAHVCEICGNELDTARTSCPYCGHAHKPVYEQNLSEAFRIVNLKKGMPLVHDALKRLDLEQKAAKIAGCRLLVLIHGYGSSGKGGVIREAVRGQLQAWMTGNAIREFLPGEELGKRSGRARQIGKRFPSLKELVRHPNPGLTLVLL